MLLESADTHNELIATLGKIYVFFGNEGQVHRNLILIATLTELIRPFFTEDVGWIDLCVECVCKSKQSFFTHDLIIKQMHFPDGYFREVVYGFVDITLLGLLPHTKEIGICTLWEDSVDDYRINAKPIKTEVHERPLCLFDNNLLRICDEANSCNLGIGKDLINPLQTIK